MNRTLHTASSFGVADTDALGWLIWVPMQTCAFEMLYFVLSNSSKHDKDELLAFLDGCIQQSGTHSPEQARQWQLCHPASGNDTDDSWLNITPDEVDDLLSRYAPKAPKDSQATKTSAAAAAAPELSDELQSIADSVRKFVSQVDPIHIDQANHVYDSEGSSDTDDEFYGMSNSVGSWLHI
jgi:hypothetical protein